MRRFFATIGMAVLALALSAPGAWAQQSASFQLQADYGHFTTGAPGNSASFQHVNDGMTWNNSVLTGNSFVITTGPAGSTSTSSSTSTTSGGSTGGGGSGVGGGEYGPRSSASSSASSVSSSAKPSSVSSSSSSRRGRPAAGSSSSSSSVAPAAIGSASSAASITLPELPAPTPESATDRGAPALRYFDAVDPLCPPTALHSAAPTESNWTWLLWILIVVPLAAGGGALTYARRKIIRKYLRKKSNRAYILCAIGVLVSFVVSIVLLGVPLSAHAANDTTPLLRTYKGNLLNSSGSPISTPVTIRFSYWKSADYVTTDVTATGAINTGASNYVGWTEVQNVTPTAQGYFAVELGSVTPLVNLANLPVSTLTSLHLQVEVKNAGTPDTAYELLDVNSSDATKDRSQVTAVPFARNADLLDQKDTGTGSFNIPYLDMSALLPKSTIPGGTNQNTFVLDSDNSATAEVVLQFGTTLAKQLTYDITNGRFNFNDDVRIQGDLTVTGLINGVNLSALQSSTGALKAFAGAGLTIGVSGGSYRLNGSVVNYAGATGVAVAASTTNYVFFGSGGLTVRASGYPTDESYIPVAEVNTNGSAVTSMLDRRVLNSDDRETAVQLVYNAEYEHASYQGDGSDNIGQLQVSHDNSTLGNYYNWNSTKATLQDYDILLRVHLSNNFVRWKTDGGTNPFSLMYRTTNASNAANKLDVQIYDTNGVPVSMSGSVTGLANTSWTTMSAEMTGGTWTPGQEFLVRIRSSAKDNFQVHIGTLKMHYVDLRPQ